jgi:hypothetical protein
MDDPAMSKLTKTDFKVKYGIAYATIADRVRRGQIGLHLIDGKIMIDEQEALEACQKRRIAKPDKLDLFSAA